jgi:uncharacterized SAM-binding protein YcdF (DUF218 family)
MSIQATDSIYSLLKQLWDYHHVDNVIEPADCIVVMGSQDLGAATRAAELYHQGMADLLLFSGGHGKITQDIWQQSEAHIFADVAMQEGVPKGKILLEEKATNCGENIRFAMQMLADLSRSPQSVILVCKPYLERRAFATFKQIYANTDVRVTSQKLSLLDYLGLVPDVELFIQLMVGDLQRILVYPARGYQIPQAVLESVFRAFQKLVQLGFNQQLIKQI